MLLQTAFQQMSFDRNNDVNTSIKFLHQILICRTNFDSLQYVKTKI